MSNNRAGAEAFILKYMDKILDGGENKTIWANRFKEMDDEAFEAFMLGLKQKTKRLAVISPNLAKNKLTVERNLALAKELGHNFFERLWMNPGNEVPPYLSHHPYLVVDLPLVRQAQLLVKKISIPEDNKSIDDLTGQPTGKSKGSKLSYPEITIMAAAGLDQNTIEMIKYRGGDTQGFNAMNDAIAKTGGVSLRSIEHMAGGVQATKTLKVFLTCMHLSNTLPTQ